MSQFELKLKNGKSVIADGKNPADTVRRYGGTGDTTVVGWRHYPRYGIFAGLDPRNCIEPGHPLFGRKVVAYCDVCWLPIYEREFHEEQTVNDGDGGDASFYVCGTCLDARLKPVWRPE